MQCLGLTFLIRESTNNFFKITSKLSSHVWSRYYLNSSLRKSSPPTSSSGLCSRKAYLVSQRWQTVALLGQTVALLGDWSFICIQTRRFLGPLQSNLTHNFVELKPSFLGMGEDINLPSNIWDARLTAYFNHTAHSFRVLIDVHMSFAWFLTEIKTFQL